MDFSPKIYEAISFAKSEALRFGNERIGIEHLTLGLIAKEDVVTQVLEGLGLDVELFRKNVENAIKDKCDFKSQSSAEAIKLPLARPVEKCLMWSSAEASICRSKDYINPEHIMLGILFYKNSTVSQLLEQEGIDHNYFKTELLYPLYSKHNTLLSAC